MGDQARRPDAPVARTRSTLAASTARPNLFRGQLTRRPTATSSNSADTLRLDVDVLSDSSEIVVRNQQGEIELGDPPSPMPEEQDDKSEDKDEPEENDRQRLAEAVKRQTVSHGAVPDQPEELLESVRADLRVKVNALAEDNWMFEPEEHTRGS